MANKIRFGLRNVKYAVFNAATGQYGALTAMPGAVSLTLSREGGDNSDFYADDGIYFTFAGTNGGYSGDLTLARITDQVRVDLLGEIADSATGVQYESTMVEPPQFALVAEMQGDQGPVGFAFYNCKANRPDIQANTKGESPTVDQETMNIRIAAQDFTLDGKTQPIVQGHIEKTDTNAAKFNAFFASVVTPGAASVESGESSLSA